MTVRSLSHLITILSTIAILGATNIQAIEVPDAVLKAEQQRIEAIRKASASTISVFEAGKTGGGGGSVGIRRTGLIRVNASSP